MTQAISYSFCITLAEQSENDTRLVNYTSLYQSFTTMIDVEGL
jgi:hypothetical protein